MKKFFLYFTITTLIASLITLVYCFINFELAGWFTYKIQFIMIPGFICIGITASLFQRGSISSKQIFHLNSTSFKDHQQESIHNTKTLDSSVPLISAILISGILQLLVGFLLYKY